MAAITADREIMQGETANVQQMYSHVPWVFGDDKPTLRTLMGLGQRITLEKDRVLLDIGKINTNLYIVDKGILLASSRGGSGQLVPRWIACHGCLIGENTLFTQHPAVYRIKAVENSELVVFGQQEVITKILPTFPEFSITLMESMAFKRFTNVARQEKQSVALRVAFFLRLCELPIMQSRVAFITLTARNIAALLEVGGAAVTKALHTLSRERIIEIDAEGLVTILDTKKLDAFIDTLREPRKTAPKRKHKNQIRTAG